MRKILIAILVGAWLAAHPALGNLSVSPFYVEFDASSPRRSDVVRLTNTGAEEKTYRIGLVNFIQNADGSYAEASAPQPDSPFAAPHLDFSPREATLKAGQSQTIRVQRRPMPTAPDGEYVSHLLIQEQPKAFPKPDDTPQDGITIDLRALYGVTIPVIITKGKPAYAATLKSARLTRLQDKDIAEVSVARLGERSFLGTLIVRRGKEEIGRVNAFRIFPSTPVRTLRIPLSQKPSGKITIILEDERTHEIMAEKPL